MKYENLKHTNLNIINHETDNSEIDRKLFISKLKKYDLTYEDLHATDIREALENDED